VGATGNHKCNRVFTCQILGSSFHVKLPMMNWGSVSRRETPGPPLYRGLSAELIGRMKEISVTLPPALWLPWGGAQALLPLRLHGKAAPRLLESHRWQPRPMDKFLAAGCPPLSLYGQAVACPRDRRRPEIDATIWRGKCALALVVPNGVGPGANAVRPHQMVPREALRQAPSKLSVMTVFRGEKS